VRPLPLVLAGLALAASASAQFSAGSTLYQPTNGTDAVLVDEFGNVKHTWPGVFTPALSVRLRPDGRLLRTISAGPSSGVQLVDWNGLVEWEYDANTPERTPHHDATFLPNGNVLILCRDDHTGAEAVALGRDPATVGANWSPEEILEVQPTGPNTGVIVWNWKVQDHLVQDFDPTKPDFGVIADHPHRIDVNYANVTGGNGDWNHANSLDYDPHLDQIVISCRRFSEVWIIDHSTTTAEAATGSGGNSGRGGDLLWRWGNPEAYGRGTGADQQLFQQHDAQWIPDGRPGAGNLLVFSNGNDRPIGPSSSVEELVLPALGPGNTYPIGPTAPWGPVAPVWTYLDPVDPLSFYTPFMGGCERLPNGNTMICLAASGILREVAPDGTTVHEFQNPLPFPTANAVFKTRTYPVDPFPTTTCTSLPNTTGATTALGWTGSVSVQRNDLELLVTGGVPNEFGLFFYGANPANAPLGDGVRCIGQPFYRLLPPVQMDAFGATSWSLDLTAPPQPGSEILPGSTWHFQFWHRDDPSQGSGSNLSDAIQISWWP
jgi:hypothetical protein